jgi:hypothetical protein
MKKLILILLLVLFVGSDITAQVILQKVLPDTPFTMAWTEGENSQGYEVEVSINGGVFTKLQDVTSTFVVTQLVDEDKAIYRVRGFLDQDAGRVFGPYSEPSDVIYAASPPTSPTLYIVDLLSKFFNKNT